MDEDVRAPSNKLVQTANNKLVQTEKIVTSVACVTAAPIRVGSLSWC